MSVVFVVVYRGGCVTGEQNQVSSWESAHIHANTINTSDTSAASALLPIARIATQLFVSHAIKQYFSLAFAYSHIDHILYFSLSLACLLLLYFCIFGDRFDVLGEETTTLCGIGHVRGSHVGTQCRDLPNRSRVHRRL